MSPVFSMVSSPVKAQQKAVVGNETLTLKARKATGQWGDKQGLKLEGSAAQPAQITHPQLDVAAPTISADFDDNRQLKSVTATGGVQFKVSMTQKDGPAVRIEAKCDNASLDRSAKARVLTLNGGVDGWFQSGNGPRNVLRGQTVKITSQPEAETNLVADIRGDAQGIRVDVPPPGNAASDAKPITITAQNAQLRQNKGTLDADVDGGAQGVRLEIPALPKNDQTGALSVGAIVVTSQRASVRQADGSARFTGNAHAISSAEGTAKFDVSAAELVINRLPNGQWDALKATGRAKVKLDLPPDANAKPLVETNKLTFGKPNYVEVEANSATANLAKNSLNFEGDVKGFYRLPSANNSPVTDYKFSGEHAVISYSPEAGSVVRGLGVEVTGDKEQAVIELPPLQLDF